MPRHAPGGRTGIEDDDLLPFDEFRRLLADGDFFLV